MIWQINYLVPTYFLLKYILGSLFARFTPLHSENVDYCNREKVNFQKLDFFDFPFPSGYYKLCHYSSTKKKHIEHIFCFIVVNNA